MLKTKVSTSDSHDPSRTTDSLAKLQLMNSVTFLMMPAFVNFGLRLNDVFYDGFINIYAYFWPR